MANYKDYGDLYEFLEATAPGSTRGVGNGTDVKNADFAFNPSDVRTAKLRANGSFDSYATTKLTRGFIRNLMVDLGKGQAVLPNIRCRFQFNPQDIEHSLEARRDMYLPILQDPAQLTQPMAGNAAFAFELIFDRTMEVNSNFSKSVIAGDKDESPGERTPDDSSPETVGVFHDLRILYSIIGTGLSKELLEAQMAKSRLDMVSYAQRSYSELNINVQKNDDGSIYFEGVRTTDEDDDDGVQDRNSVKLATFLNELNQPESEASGKLSFMSNLNIGNSAFLTPQPCRVIFSPMFMVDGFVMNTRVLFTKFSAKMIPIQCKVFIQMQAVYIGFAKKQTFLTQQYEDQKDTNTDAQEAADKAFLEILKVLGKNMRNITVGYSSDVRILGDIATAKLLGYDTINNTELSSSGSNKASTGLVYQPIWLYGTKNFWYRRPFMPDPAQQSKDSNGNSWNPAYRLNFNDSVNTPNFMPGITIKLVNTTVDKDLIAKKVFEDYKDSGPLLKITVESRIYGPFTLVSEAAGFRDSKLGPTATNYPSSSEYPEGVKLLGNYLVGMEIRDKESWEDYADRPHDLLLGSKSPSENIYNASNQAANPIEPGTRNSSNVTIFGHLDDRITAYTDNLAGTDIQKANAKKVLRGVYHNSSNISIENSDPQVDGDLDTNEMAFSSVYLNNEIPDSLLQLVDDVHDLNEKYFVVNTEVTVRVEVAGVANAGTKPFAVIAERATAVMEGKSLNHTETLYLHYVGLPATPTGSYGE